MKKQKRKRREGTSYWQSYSDMMAALLLMFVLIMAFTILQSLRHYQQLSESVIQTKTEYEQQQTELAEEIERVEEQQELLDKQRNLLMEQHDLMEQQQELLMEQQQELDEIIGIKAEIIRALSAEFAETDMAIKVDQETGSIVFDSSIVFDFNEYQIKSDAKAFLNTFFPRYFEVLMSDRFRQYISEIIIEGYTDNQGKYLYNLDLSQKRAFAIAEYCLNEKNGLLEAKELDKVKRLLTANGKASNCLKYDADGNVDAEASRRVEIKFRLTDEEMISKMQEIITNGTYSNEEMWERINNIFLNGDYFGM